MASGPDAMPGGLSDAPDTSLDDFDLLDPDYRADPASRWDAMRDRCPVAHSSRHGGGWMLSRYEDIVRVALDTETFSSRAGDVTGPIPSVGRELRMPPETSDPPVHAYHRSLMTPFFTQEAVAHLETITNGICQRLLDEIAAQDRVVDVVDEYAGAIPVKITSEMLGLPASDATQFQGWLVDMLKYGAEDFRLRAESIRKINAHLRDMLSSHKDQTREGSVLSHLLVRQREDARVTDDTIIGMAFLMLVGGIDTVWNVMGSAIWHLAAHPEDRAFMLDNPEAVETSVEELLRIYAPVTIGRLVVKDTEIAGRSIAAGERIIIPWAAANRDPAVQEHPQSVCVSSGRDRHLSFGYGIHRCLGAPLALMELRVGLTAWLTRFPNYTLATDQIEWTAGSTRGPKSLPVRLKG